jgi:hypothetical protein
MSRVLLASLVALILVPLFFLPMYYRNMVLLPDGSMSYLDGPADPLFHLSVANELTHSVPPQVPFLAGQPLPYHYAMHLLAAMLSNVARLTTLDLMFRFLPTFFLAVTALAIFCFARIWMGSSYAALLAAFLVIVGEDFSFIPGLLLKSDEVWSYWFFHVPTIYSCYFINPILPTLAILFAGLLCLVRFYEKGGRGWLVVTACWNIVFLVPLDSTGFTFTSALGFGLAALSRLSLLAERRAAERRDRAAIKPLSFSGKISLSYPSFSRRSLFFRKCEMMLLLVFDCQVCNRTPCRSRNFLRSSKVRDSRYSSKVAKRASS